MDGTKLVGKANPQRGEVDVQVGDRTWRLRSCANAMIRLEEATEQRATWIQAKFQRGEETLGDVRALLFSLLTEHQPEITLDDVGDLMDEMNKLGPEEVQKTIADALAVGSPEPSEADPPRPGSRRAKKTAKKTRRGGTGAGRSGSRSATGSRPTGSSG